MTIHAAQFQLERLHNLVEASKDKAKLSEEAQSFANLAISQLLLLVLADNPDVQNITVRYERSSNSTWVPVCGIKVTYPPVFFTLANQVHDLRGKFDETKDLRLLNFEVCLLLKQLLESHLQEHMVPLHGITFTANRSELNDLIGSPCPEIGTASQRMTSLAPMFH